MPRAANIHSEHALLLAFPRNWQHDRSTVLRVTHIACLVATVTGLHKHFLGSKPRTYADVG